MSAVAYFLTFSFTAVSWIVLISGVSSVQYWCGGGCRTVLGLPWWLLWFQFVTFCGVIANFSFVRNEASKAIRIILLSFLSINALLAMIVADRMLDYRGGATLSTARVNTAAAGAIMTAIFDLLLIVLLGLEEGDSSKFSPMRSHTNPVAETQMSPPLPPMPASRPASNV